MNLMNNLMGKPYEAYELIYDSALQEFTFYSRKVGQEAGELWLLIRVHLEYPGQTKAWNHYFDVYH